MHIQEILKKSPLSVSFEFFPPKSEAGAKSLFNTIYELEELNPAYVSVTYGAGGGSKQFTQDLLVKLQKKTNLNVVAHLTCVGQSKGEIFDVLEKFQEAGIQNVLALRGDPPGGQREFEVHPDGFEYAADLVGFIKKNFPEMGIGVAGFPEGHPDCANRIKELEHLKTKIDAGADYICTQMFFDNRDFYDFRDRCSIVGIDVPIIAGVMPITSRAGIRRMSELALGCRFPAKLLKALGRAEDDESVAKVGTHWATNQVLDLLENKIDGIHFYTLNKSRATREIYRSLGIDTSDHLSRAITF